MANGTPAAATEDLYAPGAAVEVWSTSDKVWYRGSVKSVDEGLVTLEYTKTPGSNTNNKVVKVLPLGHQDLRPAGQASSSNSTIAIGTPVKVWSNTDSKWCEGKVLSVEENIVSLEYVRDEGSSSKVVKSLPLGHPDLRLSALPSSSKSQDKPNIDQRNDFIHICCIASMLCLLSGAINAVAVLELGMSVGHHTGNTHGLGRELGVSGLRLVPSLLGYLLGAASAGYGRCSGDAIFEGQASGGLLCSAGMVAAAVFAHVATGKTNVSVPLFAYSQGLQNAATSAFSSMPLRTSHMTGCLSDAGSGVGAFLRAWRDGQKAPSLRKPMLNAVMLLGFVGGGCAGACGRRLIGVQAALVPATLLAVLASGSVSNTKSSKKHD